MNKLSYEEALEKAPFLIVSTIGTSMLPLIKEGENTIKITKVSAKLKRGDVLLFKRDDGSYVLHRLVRVKKDKLLMCGDNQVVIEKIDINQVIGIMDGYFIGEEFISIDNKEYIKYYKKRLFNRPFRRFKYLVKRLIKKE